MQLTQDQAKDFIMAIKENNDTRIFRVTVKRRRDGKNGEKAGDERVFVCRFGSKKLMGTGVRPHTSTKFNGLVLVDDVQAQEPRYVNLSDIVNIRVAGEEYQIK